MFFTQQFIKDLFWSLIFIASWYGLTHNHIIRPMPQPLPGNWSIQIMQHPLIFGITGHNYIILRDPDSEIVSELHGLATNTITGAWKYIGNDSSDILQVWEFNGPRSYLAEKSYPGIILSEGKYDDIISKWNKATACKKPINEKRLPYPPFGLNLHGDSENSNSVAYTLAICMGTNAKHIGLFTPGEGINLLAK